jgi:phosphoribosyl 1,2-cyclic phosphodiesterase
MALHFQSIRSSSKGNCLAVFTEKTRILIDVGLSSMKRTRAGLAGVFGDPSDVDAVIVSHTHSDHVSYYPLRVLADTGIPLNIHQRCVQQLEQKHFTGPNGVGGLGGLKVRTFDDKPFEIGEINIQPFEVSHNPYYPTFGFVIRHENSKLVVATDLNSFDGIVDHFLDADAIFIEANHDLELLEQYYNPNSHYHLPNPLTAQLLDRVCTESSAPPKEVMLGHISPQRNTAAIAIKEVGAHFARNKKNMDFHLSVAPLNTAADPITI